MPPYAESPPLNVRVQLHFMLMRPPPLPPRLLEVPPFARRVPLPANLTAVIRRLPPAPPAALPPLLAPLTSIVPLTFSSPGDVEISVVRLSSTGQSSVGAEKNFVLVVRLSLPTWNVAFPLPPMLESERMNESEGLIPRPRARSSAKMATISRLE